MNATHDATSYIPRPHGTFYKFPSKADLDDDEADREDKRQTLIEMTEEVSWEYRLLVGYIASMKKLPLKSSNTHTS